MSKNNPNFNIKSPKLSIGVKKRQSPSIMTGPVDIKKPKTDINIKKEIEIDIVFLKSCLQSSKISDVQFSNYLNDKFYLQNEKSSIEKITKDTENAIQVRNAKPISFKTKNARRIKYILENYLSDEYNFSNYDDVIYEAYTDDGLNLTNKGKFRTFFIMGMEHETLSAIIFLFDPYHLVCPVAFNNKTKEQVQKQTFEEVKHYSNTFADIFGKEFERVNFIDE